MTDKTKNISLVIQVSTDGKHDWNVIMRNDLPDWVSSPDNVKRMMDGYEICYDKDITSYRWYRAIIVPDEETQCH